MGSGIDVDYANLELESDDGFPALNLLECSFTDYRNNDIAYKNKLFYDSTISNQASTSTFPKVEISKKID